MAGSGPLRAAQGVALAAPKRRFAGSGRLIEWIPVSSDERPHLWPSAGKLVIFEPGRVGIQDSSEHHGRDVECVFAGPPYCTRVCRQRWWIIET